MAYIELSDTMFRGTLKGARGKARFKLTAKAINAIDTVNINYNMVTYDYNIKYSTPSQSAGSVLVTAGINVPDEEAWVEIIAYGAGAGSVRVNGNTMPNRNLRGPGQKLLPFVSMVKLPKGKHTVQLISAASGASSGFIMCRYIRKTGG